MRIVLLPLALLGASPVVAQQRPVVVTDAGDVRGTAEAGIDAFKGIPFAAPPVGPLRWRAPQPPARWNRIRDASAYGHDCMQKPFDSDAAPLGTEPAEDCLVANVWRPVGATGRPVLVWIYGGGFVNGGSSPPTYSGAAMAAKGVVFVSFNYRLGRFGSFAHPALTRANADGGLLANYGYLDQIAALRWVKRNIAAFGGDPGKVTIVGESAGGFSVHALLTSPMTSGLFRGAVIQSGGLADEKATDLAAAEMVGSAFAKAKGVTGTDAAALAALRALPAASVVDGLNLASRGGRTGPETYVGPVADGRIAVDPLAAYRAGRFARVPVMLGATSDDIGGPDGYMATGAARMADLFARAGEPTWRYRFSYVADSARTPQTRGAAHATDIPFFFDTADVKYGAATTPTDRRAAALASDYLATFVARGDPNAPGRPAWPRYRAGGTTLDLDAAGGATPLPAR
jgi:para-nitrobenzyl esterase